MKKRAQTDENSASWFVGELECRRVGYQRVELSSSQSVGELVVGELSVKHIFSSEM